MPTTERLCVFAHRLWRCGAIADHFVPPRPLDGAIGREGAKFLVVS